MACRLAADMIWVVQTRSGLHGAARYRPAPGGRNAGAAAVQELFGHRDHTNTAADWQGMITSEPLDM